MQQLSALGIDLTSLIVYLVNFGLIYVIVGKLISKPIIEILEKRKLEIETNLTEANKLREEMVAEKNKFETEKEKIRAEFDLELEKFEASIQEKTRLLDQENQKIREDIIQKAQQEQKQIKENIFKIIQEDLINSYTVIVSKVLKDRASEPVVIESIKNSWENFKSKKL